MTRTIVSVVLSAIVLIGGLVLARVIWEHSRQLGPIVNRPVEAPAATPGSAVATVAGRPAQTPPPARNPPAGSPATTRPAVALASPAPSPPPASPTGSNGKLPLTYVADGTFAGGSLTRLGGIAIDAKRDLLVLGGDRDVVIVDLKSGDQVQRFDAKHAVLSVGVGDDGSIFVGEDGQAEKYRRADTGDYALQFALVSGNMNVTAVHQVGGEIVCANVAGRRLVRFDKSGKPRGKQIPSTQLDLGKPPANSLLVPNDTLDFAAAPNGQVVLCHPGEHRVEAYTLDGKLQWRWGGTERDPEDFAGCCNPVNVAVFPLDNLKLKRPDLSGRGLGLGVVTAEKGPARVKVYDQKGNLLAVIEDGAQFNRDNRHMYLAVDAEGRLYVADTENKIVRRFKVKG